jgi:hypothetical protein
MEASSTFMGIFLKELTKKMPDIQPKFSLSANHFIAIFLNPKRLLKALVLPQISS